MLDIWKHIDSIVPKFVWTVMCEKEDFNNESNDLEKTKSSAQTLCRKAFQQKWINIEGAQVFSRTSKDKEWQPWRGAKSVEQLTAYGFEGNLKGI